MKKIRRGKKYEVEHGTPLIVISWKQWNNK
jgi:hypothetical protein